MIKEAKTKYYKTELEKARNDSKLNCKIIKIATNRSKQIPLFKLLITNLVKNCTPQMNQKKYRIILMSTSQFTNAAQKTYNQIKLTRQNIRNIEYTYTEQLTLNTTDISYNEFSVINYGLTLTLIS